MCGPKAHDVSIITEKPDHMRAIDATGCIIGEGNATVFVVVDHCTRDCLGVRAALRGRDLRRWSASERR